MDTKDWIYLLSNLETKDDRCRSAAMILKMKPSVRNKSYHEKYYKRNGRLGKVSHRKRRLGIEGKRHCTTTPRKEAVVNSVTTPF